MDMQNIVDINYKQTGKSTQINKLGMREMQQRAYNERNAQYLLLKSPPASGKSRAMMFIALDKLINQGINKVIIAVPERSIGSSFSSTNLTSTGFFADWEPSERYNLCIPGGEKSKVRAFKEFLDSTEKILICTHSTLRFAFEEIDTNNFNNILLGIDEFHHVSSDSDNKIGEILRDIISNTNAHIVAMTGSYFRGDSVPVLLPEDESKFIKVTYNYYEQLNGYKYLKSLGIGYHFYQGKYTSAISEVLDTNKKTIIHIPNVNSVESTKDKHNEVDLIIDIIGELQYQDNNTGILYVKRYNDNKIVKVADLVEDRPKEREKVVNYLRNIEKTEDLDIIIALGMAKEGFDWPFCEHALTIGYRGSLTEIIQIIGRCTRDSFNKTHAQFTNLIAQPEANDDLVKLSVNNMLKAITASLLMEQVLAPNFKFKPKKIEDGDQETIRISGMKQPSSKRVKDILENDLNELKASILQDNQIIKAMPGNIDPEVMNKVLIPKIIQVKYPELTDEEIDEVREYVVVDSVIKSGEIKEVGDNRFIKLANQFINIDDLHIDLIDRINPFQKAFEILSKTVTTNVLKLIKESIDATRIQMSEEEAIILWPKINEFIKINRRHPNIESLDPLEKRMAEAIIFLKELKRKMSRNE